MEKRKPYRNSIRSEKMIIRAFVELMQKKDEKKITVTDVVNEADINRSTFYAHFKSIDDVRERIHSDVMESIMIFVNKGSDNGEAEPERTFDLIVNFLESDASFYKALINRVGADKFLRQLREKVIGICLNNPAIMNKVSDRKKLEVAMRIFIGGYVSIIEDWANGSLNATLAECTDVMKECIWGSIDRYAEA